MKFKTTDKEYLNKRRKLSQQMGKQELWSVIDQWPLYVGVANLGRYMAISDLLRSTLKVPGHVVEFGSWKGANLMFMAKLLRLFDPHGNKEIHCFESFDGLKTFASCDGRFAMDKKGKYKGDYNELIDFVKLYGFEDDIVIHAGDIINVLPDVLQANEGLSFSFVYCDTDLYAPSRLILESIHPRLSKGGLIVFDEWNFEKWPGESVAVREFMEGYGSNYEMNHLQNTRQPSLVLKKIR